MPQQNHEHDAADIIFDMPPHKNILVIKLGALGDFVQALGPMNAIRRHHPAASITLLTTDPYVSLGLACGNFDHVWTDKKPKWYDLNGWIELRKKLNVAGFDRVYDLQNNDRTALYLRLFKTGNRPEWVGAARGASHRNNSPKRTSGPAIDGHKQTLAIAGINHVDTDDLRWIEGDISHYKLPRPYILLIPGSAPDRPEKRWPAQNYGKLAKALSGKGYLPVIVGTKAEKDLADQIRNCCPEAVDLTGETALFDIAALARQSSGTIGNDTGPVHLAAPTGCPTWVLFSKHTDPQRHAPAGRNVHIIRNNHLDALSAEKVLEQISPNL